MPKTIDVNLLNPFISAALDCLRQMAGAKPERKRVFVKTDPTMHGDICGIIGMTNGITGSCVVSFPDALARRIVADRIEHGPFGSADELQRVRGVSASLARRMLPYVTFSRLPVTLGRAEEPKKQPPSRQRRKQP